MAGQPAFMTGLKVIPTRALAKVSFASLGGKGARPAIVLNLCRMPDAGTNGDWAVVQKRAAGFWMNTSGTPNFPQVMARFANKVVFFELTPSVIRNKQIDLTLREANKLGASVGGAAWYFGDENPPSNAHWRADTMDVIRSLAGGVADCLVAMCRREEWFPFPGRQWMGKPGPPRNDVAGGAYQASKSCGVCFEMSFESWDNPEMIRAMEWCRANKKLFIMLAHTDQKDYIGAIKKAVAGMKARNLWPDIIVPSNYGPNTILPAVPEGRGSEYPNTMTSAARYLIEAWD